VSSVTWADTVQCTPEAFTRREQDVRLCRSRQSPLTAAIVLATRKQNLIRWTVTLGNERH
jgi:hypothetical protein